MPSLIAGTRLGPYEILAPLGAGGMGEVYKARDTRLQRSVALKVLSAELAVDQTVRARFEREARAIAALSHPHICTVHDVGQDQGVDYLVMEHLEGETLADRLTRARGPLPLDQAVKVGREIADALEKAHRAGIVHRDLKPANIMLTKSGAKLLDFGLAKLRGPAVPISMSAIEGATTTSPATAHGTILGTIHYMAPEQVEGREADTRSDIWALGAVLYEMTTGRRPFEGQSAASVIGGILKDTPSPISARQPVAPPALDHLVERCLDKDADERWQNAGDVKRELTWISRTHPTSVDASARSSRGVRRLLPWLAAVVFTAGIGIGAARFFALPEPIPAARSTLAIVPPDGIRIVGAAALSPDGRSFVFVGQGRDGPPALWVQSIDSGRARPLADTDDPAYPFWSPASDSIGFFAAGRLKTINAGGSPPRVLATAANGRGGSWGPDGTILFVPDTNSSVLRIPEKGGDASPVTTLDSAGGQIGHRWPRHIDAQHFVFTVQASRPESIGIYLATLGSRATSRLAPQFSNTEYDRGQLLFIADGMIVARSLDLAGPRVGGPVEVAGPVAYTGGLGFNALSTAAGRLAYAPGAGAAPTRLTQWFDRDGKALGRVGEGSDLVKDNSYYQSISPDGRRVALAAFQSPTADLWLVDTVRDVASRFTFDSATDFNPAWSPDSSQLLYSSNRSGFFNIYLQSVSEPGEERRLAEAASHQYPTDWSADGTIILTNVDPKTQADIWTMPAAGGRQTPLLVTSFNEYAARRSPGGEWMAYTSDESGRAEVYVQRYPSGRDKARASTQGGSHPQWRADGRELFYLGADRRLMVVSTTLSPSLAVGRPVKVFEIPVDTSLGSIHANHFAVNADGQRFLLGVSGINQSSSTVVLNWTEVLTPPVTR